jgi:hypothetical protein
MWSVECGVRNEEWGIQFEKLSVKCEMLNEE